VFATETLALGINMPARTVVIEKLSKFTGERHEFLTPGEYTQLTGRAGRRGLDPVGYAVVLWSPFVPFEQVASLASSRAFRLTSAFRPTVQHGRQPRAAVSARRRAPSAQPVVRAVPDGPLDRPAGDTPREAASGTRSATQSRRAAIVATSTSNRGLLDAADETRRKVVSPEVRVAEALARLRPGDVVEIGAGRRGGRAAVLSFANSPRRVRA